MNPSTQQASMPVRSKPGKLIEEEFLCRLQQVLDRLRIGGIAFCVLRNRRRIPSSLANGSDVDLLVPANTPVRTIVSLIADLSPAQIVAHMATLEVYFRVGDLFLHVDFLIGDRQWRGACYLENREILADAQEEDGLPVASLAHQAFCAWFSSLTRQRIFKTRYIPLITAAIKACPLEMSVLLQRAFGLRLAGELLQLAQQRELDRCHEFAGRCRRAIWWNAFRRRPLATLRGLLKFYAPELKLYGRPTGWIVAVLGPDGAGKSTVCSILAESSKAALPFSRIEVEHLYERALPRLSELCHGRFRRRPAAPATTHDPHGKRPHGLVGSVVSLAYTAIDQWISRICLGRRKVAKNMLMLHDRHMIEILVDPKRFRYGGPVWLARLYAKLIPKPDLVVLLDSPAEVLQSRKREVPFEETRRQREAYCQLIGNLHNGAIFDAGTRSPEEVAALVKGLITGQMARRAARTYGLADADGPQLQPLPENLPPPVARTDQEDKLELQGGGCTQ